MSFDVFLERFDAGRQVDVDAAAVRTALGPLLVEHDPEHRFARLRTADGGAEVYGYPAPGAPDPVETLMVGEVEGDAVWDAVVDCARAGGLTVLPQGGPVLVTSPAALADLPAEHAAGAVVVTSGAELLAAVRGG